MTIEKRLAEREKEISCIYSICLLAAEAANPEMVAEGVASALCAAMQHEEQVICVVNFQNIMSGKEVSIYRGCEESNSTHSSSTILSSNSIKHGQVTAKNRKKDKKNPGINLRNTTVKFSMIEVVLPEDTTLGGWIGSIRLEYRNSSIQFLPEEKALLNSVLIVAASMLRTSNLFEDLKLTSSNLETKNIALREVLSLIENEKRIALKNLRKRLSTDILPLAEQVRNPLLSQEKRNAYLDLLIDEIGRDITASGSDPVTHNSLSPREREIAVQVRNGRTSKEIAELLGIAEATVERHRHNIRRKLKIANQTVNLAGLLSNEDSASVTSE